MTRRVALATIDDVLEGPAYRALATRAGPLVGGALILSACATLVGPLDEFPPPDSTGASGGEGALGGGGQGSAGGGTAARSGSGGSAKGGASAVGGGGAGGGSCPAPAFGPVMVAVSGSYCIDKTEVTAGQYQKWLDTGPSMGGQLPECMWNDTFVPTTEAPAKDVPVGGVDWCDAYAFCEAAGKRLCGHIRGGPVDYISGWANALESQWFAACTQNGATPFPYGTSYEGATCNGYDANQGVVVEVTTLADCHGSVAPYNQVFDMSGNASEWEDSCDAAVGPDDHCHRRGGAAATMTSTNLACNAAGATPYTRDDASDSQLGFRCCLDL